MSFKKVFEKYSKESGDVVYVHSFESPLGTVIAAADLEYLYLVTFEDFKNLEKKVDAIAEELNCSFQMKVNAILKKTHEEIDDYFDGKLKKFTIPVKTIGSAFQKEVWNKLQQLPYGTTRSYGDLAKDLGRPASHSRAVGAACGANAHLLVVPCHRLVASGSKGGFNNGKERKEKLIDLEKKYA